MDSPELLRRSHLLLCLHCCTMKPTGASFTLLYTTLHASWEGKRTALPYVCLQDVLACQGLINAYYACSQQSAASS